MQISLGISETNQGHTTEAQRYYYAAIEDFDKAISYDKHDTYAYIIRGYTRICLGDYEFDIGNMEDARSLYEAAITDCDSAIKLDTEHPYCYHTRGVAKADSLMTTMEHLRISIKLSISKPILPELTTIAHL